ncbi:Ferredoxin [Streptomyces sp. OV198]|jgi:ferredoxin|uniref:ferredoxin n=1 Tax=Streptomyces sp. OV198 TaxID=1882787 RepID=UPI000BD8F6AE|nr:ferredoxin [Streptomyces sp. OV198]SOF02263.1 Ferredoxin [Streptomyces sp. OV198]
MNVTVEEDKCVAAGQCVVAAPEVFDQRDEDGVVILLQEQPPAAEFEHVRTAAAICPAAAIRLAESLHP